MSPDGAWIVSASNDATLKIWDVASGSERATLTSPATLARWRVVRTTLHAPQLVVQRRSCMAQTGLGKYVAVQFDASP